MYKHTKTKFFYKDGEKLPNPKCRCPNKNKSKCFRVFRLDKKGEFDGWLIDCPYFRKVSRDAVVGINRILSKQSKGRN